MKYIRTENTIFEVISETELVYLVVAKNKKNHYSKSKCQTNVIDSADTIEELCDDFVSVWKHGFMPIGEIVPLCYIKDKYNYDAEFIYGGIWTNKGLIYVAKLNDKGELELL